MKFADLRLAEPILRSVASEGYTIATPIQAEAIPAAMEGRDVLGCAQTGTGKTAAFALPILHRFATSARPAGRGVVRCLVLCPTRELAVQSADAFRVYGKNLGLRYAVVYGGVGQGPQVQALRQGVDVLVATPGRLLDLMNQGHADLRGVEVLVLDEADRMLDMGFINDIRKIVAKLSAKRQTLFFSATMPNEIRSLADALLNNPVNIQVAAVAATADNVQQTLYFVERNDKASLLAHLYESLPMARTIVFTRTKRGADRVVKRLHASGIRAEAIHGDKSQNARERALKSFKMNKTPVLVATDIASRGIDVDGITHVVNYDLTHEPETYVHRIGRTARAGASGMAVSFCDAEEVPNLRDIERLLKKSIPVMSGHPYRSESAAAKAAPRSGGHHRSEQHGSAGRSPSRHASAEHAAPRHAAHSSERPSHRRNERSDRPVHAKPERANHPVGRGVHVTLDRATHSRPAEATHAAPARHSAEAKPRALHPLSTRPTRPGHGQPHAKPMARHASSPKHPVAHKRPVPQ